MNNSNTQIIDLTDSFTFDITWPVSNTVIELDDTTEPLHSATRSNARTCTNTFSDSIVDVEENNGSSCTKKKKSTSKKKNNFSQSKVKDTEANYRDRSPINFGDCPICFDYLGKNPLASTRCGHVFCTKCLEQTLKVEKKCPTCRKLLRGTSAYHPLYLSRV